MTQTITKITAQEIIDKIVLQKANALVRITTTWSIASQIFHKSIEELVNQHRDEVTFFALDYEADSALTTTYRVEPIPTILFFKNGTLVDRLSGLTNKRIISEKLTQLVNN